jgi:signal transduction histidine kinase
MTSSGDLSLPTAESMLATAHRFDGFAAASRADLVFTQTALGQYLSFYWGAAEQHGLKAEQVIGHSVTEVFTPVAVASYLEQVSQVLERLTPVQFECAFVYANQHWVFDLTISPILMPQGVATTVVGVGQFLRMVAEGRARDEVCLNGYSVFPQIGSSQLLQLACAIRRTLELSQIWQQTVDYLGTTLNTSRCLICPYQLDGAHLTVVAEYRLPHLPSLMGKEISLAEPYVREALTTLKPVWVEPQDNSGDEKTPAILAIPTYYEDQPNSLIIVHQLGRSPRWSGAELERLRQMADQIGVGIAQASQYEESRNLSTELQRVNENLMQQHSDLEEARQQAEAASRLKSEFLANTSHELRTPLNGIIGFLKLVMDGMADDPEEQHQFIQEAHRSALHLFNVINDILDIAKIEAGKMQLDLNPIKLDDLLVEVENFTRPQAQQKQLSFEIRTPDTRDEVILYGNYQRLLQVMLNLVGNAIKFTHEGSITISAEVVPGKVLVQDEEKPGSVKISVADTGIGVSLEKQDKLFQSFSQVDGSRTRQYGGTGLGLAISQKLVETMGGIVNFFSMGEGLGSTVTFTVPLYQDPVMVAAPVTDSADLLL